MQIKQFKWFIGLLTAMHLVYFTKPTFAEEKKISDVTVATVNGAVITQDDFDVEMARVLSQFSGQGRQLNESQLRNMKKGILETLINRELLYQESQKRGIKIVDKEVDDQVDMVKKRFPNENEFKAAILKMNITEAELKSQIRESMAIQLFIDKFLVHEVKVAEAEVKNFYKDNPNMFQQPEQIKASHILIKVGSEADEPTKDKANKRIKEIQKKLNAGEDFSSLAKEFSEGPSNIKGGDLGYFNRGQMVKPFEEAAFKLKPGEVSDIVETRFGYHLIKVVDKKPESVVSYENVKDKIAQYMEQEKKGKLIQTDIEKLRQKAVIETFLTL